MVDKVALQKIVSVPSATKYFVDSKESHVASYKEGRENLIRGAEAIQKKVGNIPRGHLKRYGKALLIKAGNETQAALLSNFKPSTEGNIKSISPHKSFNTFKGIVYSKELHDFEDWEILEQCPPSVFKAQKLKGDNHAILLTFTSSHIPDVINLEHTRIKVKKYYRRPTQCFKCFEYGHGYDKCKNERKCSHCSGNHEAVENCANNTHCFLCDGDHSPKSRNCPRFLFEQEVLDVANNQFISIGSAKQIVMGANKTPNSSYAKIVKDIKLKSFRVRNKQSPTTKDPPRESPDTDAPEKPLPPPSSPAEGAKAKTRKNEPKERTNEGKERTSELKEKPKEPKDTRSSKGATGTTNKVPEQGKAKKAKTSNKMEECSKKASRDDRDATEGFIPPKRMRSYRSSEEELAVSNSFAVLESLEVTDTQCSFKPQRARSVENIPNTSQQYQALTPGEGKASPHDPHRRSSFSKPFPPASRVRKLDFNHFQQCEGLQKPHAAGNK